LVQLLTQIFAVGCKLCPTQDHTLANYRRQVRDIVEQVSSFTKTLDVRIWVAYIAAEASLGEFEEAKKAPDQFIYSIYYHATCNIIFLLPVYSCVRKHCLPFIKG
jgi:hypothetical protein